MADRLGERRLADPRLATDQHEVAVPTVCRVEMLAQQTEFALAPDQIGWRWPGRLHAIPFAECVDAPMSGL
jgi:hypothetical protein